MELGLSDPDVPIACAADGADEVLGRGVTGAVLSGWGAGRRAFPGSGVEAEEEDGAVGAG